MGASAGCSYQECRIWYQVGYSSVVAKDKISAKYDGLAKNLVRKNREAKQAEARRRRAESKRAERERKLGSYDVFAQNRNYSLQDQNFEGDRRADMYYRNKLNKSLAGVEPGIDVATGNAAPGVDVKITATEFRTEYPERVADIAFRPNKPYFDYIDPVYGRIRPEPPINQFKVQGWRATK